MDRKKSLHDVRQNRAEPPRANGAPLSDRRRQRLPFKWSAPKPAPPAVSRPLEEYWEKW